MPLSLELVTVVEVTILVHEDGSAEQGSDCAPPLAATGGDVDGGLEFVELVVEVADVADVVVEFAALSRPPVFACCSRCNLKTKKNINKIMCSGVDKSPRPETLTASSLPLLERLQCTVPDSDSTSVDCVSYASVDVTFAIAACSFPSFY